MITTLLCLVDTILKGKTAILVVAMATRFIVVIMTLNQHCVFHVGRSKAVEKRALRSHRVSRHKKQASQIERESNLNRRPIFYTVISSMENIKKVMPLSA